MRKSTAVDILEVYSEGILQLFKYNWKDINLNKNGSSTLLTSLIVGVSGVLF